MSEDKKDIVSSDDDHILVKVLGTDGSETQFKIKKRVAFGKLMKAYCQRANLNIITSRFRFEGQPVTASDTPITLQMEDGDTLEVFEEATGGKSGNNCCPK